MLFFPLKACMKWVHLVQWEHLDSKGSVETLAAQGVLLQALLVKEVLQASQVRSSMCCPRPNLTKASK